MQILIKCLFIASLNLSATLCSKFTQQRSTKHQITAAEVLPTFEKGSQFEHIEFYRKKTGEIPPLVKGLMLMVNEPPPAITKSGLHIPNLPEMVRPFYDYSLENVKGFFKPSGSDLVYSDALAFVLKAIPTLNKTTLTPPAWLKVFLQFINQELAGFRKFIETAPPVTPAKIPSLGGASHETSGAQQFFNLPNQYPNHIGLFFLLLQLREEVHLKAAHEISFLFMWHRLYILAKTDNHVLFVYELACAIRTMAETLHQRVLLLLKKTYPAYHSDCVVEIDNVFFSFPDSYERFVEHVESWVKVAQKYFSSGSAAAFQSDRERLDLIEISYQLLFELLEKMNGKEKMIFFKYKGMRKDLPIDSLHTQFHFIFSSDMEFHQRKIKEHWINQLSASAEIHRTLLITLADLLPRESPDPYSVSFSPSILISELVATDFTRLEAIYLEIFPKKNELDSELLKLKALIMGIPYVPAPPPASIPVTLPVSVPISTVASISTPSETSALEASAKKTAVTTPRKAAPTSPRNFPVKMEKKSKSPRGKQVPQQGHGLERKKGTKGSTPQNKLKTKNSPKNKKKNGKLNEKSPTEEAATEEIVTEENPQTEEVTTEEKPANEAQTKTKGIPIESIETQVKDDAEAFGKRESIQINTGLLESQTTDPSTAEASTIESKVVSVAKTPSEELSEPVAYLKEEITLPSKMEMPAPANSPKGNESSNLKDQPATEAYLDPVDEHKLHMNRKKLMNNLPPPIAPVASELDFSVDLEAENRKACDSLDHSKNYYWSLSKSRWSVLISGNDFSLLCQIYFGNKTAVSSDVVVRLLTKLGGKYRGLKEFSGSHLSVPILLSVAFPNGLRFMTHTTHNGRPYLPPGAAKSLKGFLIVQELQPAAFLCVSRDFDIRK